MWYFPLADMQWLKSSPGGDAAGNAPGRRCKSPLFPLHYNRGKWLRSTIWGIYIFMATAIF